MVMSSAAGLPLSHPAMNVSRSGGVVRVSDELLTFLHTNAQVGMTTAPHPASSCGA